MRDQQMQCGNPTMQIAKTANEVATCKRCKGRGWLEPIGPMADGSYITSRECPRCRGTGKR